MMVMTVITKNMKTYTFPLDKGLGSVFGIAKTISGTYVCPGWHLVPDGTTREQIRFSGVVNTSKKQLSPEPPKVIQTKRKWQANGSKEGVVYQITEDNNVWDCTCPAKNFFRGDCKHIKAKKSELNSL